MYAKIINEQTKQCEVGLGTNTAFYQKIGMTEMNVEKAWNGLWYMEGYVPEKPEEEIKRERREELLAQLDQLDLKCIRALRAIQAGTGTQADTDKLAELEQQAEEVRAELKELGVLQ